jgi:hypothetical protein
MVLRQTSITQTSEISAKTIKLWGKYFVPLLVLCQSMVIASFIQIKNSAATDFWQKLLISHGIPAMPSTKMIYQNSTSTNFWQMLLIWNGISAVSSTAKQSITLGNYVNLIMMKTVYYNTSACMKTNLLESNLTLTKTATVNGHFYPTWCHWTMHHI